MKRYISSDMSSVSPIFIIAIVDDVNIATPTVFAPVLNTVDDDWDVEDILDLYEVKGDTAFRQISDPHILNLIMQVIEDTPGFEYKFTRQQRDILQNYYKDHVEFNSPDLSVANLIEFIHSCKRCTIPYYHQEPELLYKNFAEYNNLDLSPKDYLAILQKFQVNNFKQCIRSKYSKYLGDKIYQFYREDDYTDSKGNSIGHHNLWVEINLRITSEDKIVALISMHDAETKEPG